MSKRKKADPNPEEEEDDDDNQPRDKQRQQVPQKVYDFHKKTIEVYPERLRELNRQFLSSLSSQITTEPYSVLVGNCLDYVRQYFKYEDDFLQYSPWLATRLKQSRSDIVKCLQETIDVYEALARHDFDHFFDKNNNQTSSDDSVTNKSDSTAQSTTPSFQYRPSTTTTNSSIPSSTLTKPTVASDSTPSTSFSFAKSTTSANDSAPSTGFTFTKPSSTTATSDSTSFTFAKSTTSASDSAPSSDFTFAKSTTSASDSAPSTGFTFTKPLPTTTTSDSTGFTFAKSTAAATTTTTTSSSVPLTGFSFKMSTPTTASPEKTANTSPFAFSIPSTGFGTSTFSSPSSGFNPINLEKSSTSSASSISFTPPPKFSFAPTPSVGAEQQGNTEDNDDEASEPPEPEKVEHESDAKLTYRCRMGVKKGDKLIKRGPVQVILKEANEKHQLIVRSDDTLGRLYLNILWSKLIEVKKNSTKDLVFVCQLNPGMPEVKEGEFVTILFRFDNETERNDAHDKLNKERT